LKVRHSFGCRRCGSSGAVLLFRGGLRRVKAKLQLRSRKSLICRVSSVVEQRFCNSALAISPRFIECRLVNVSGPKMPASARHHSSPSYRVPPSSFAKMLAAGDGKPASKRNYKSTRNGGRIGWAPPGVGPPTPAGFGIRCSPRRGPRQREGAKDHLRPNAGALPSHEDW